MGYADIEEEIRGKVAVLRLNRPGAGNKLSVGMMEELSAALQAAGADAGIGAVVLGARGEVFCAGGDLGDFRRQAPSEIRRFGEAFIALQMRIGRIGKPVVAAVNGAVCGGGCGLVDSCDLAVAAEDATFSVPEIKAGLAPMMSMVGVGRNLSRKLACELAFTGESLTAAEARNHGLINRVTAVGQAECEALAWAAQLAEYSPVAMDLAKKLFRGLFDRDYQAQLEKGLDVLVSLLKSEDVMESLTAAREGRAPNWTGR